MISYIKGTVEFCGADHAVIECGNIGYKVHMPLTSLSSLGTIGSNVKVFTYLYIREDILDLYGFASEEALALFEMLLSVNGVGPRAAISLLSVFEPSDFKAAVASGDHKSIAKAQGIGPKTAQRIVLELKDKVGREGVTKSDMPSASLESNAFNEALGALTALGYSYNESKQALSGGAGTTEELIKFALKQLMR